MKVAIVVLLSLKLHMAFAQYETSFAPHEFQDTIPPEIHQALKKRLADDRARVTVKGKEGEYIKTLYEQRFDYVVNTFNEDYFAVEHPLTAALKKIADRIYAANPDLPRETNIYTYRSGSPNAMSFGEGTISVMLGLLERLETEDQAAYILCHELAHYHAQHAEQNFARLAALNYDKELKSKISAIKSNPYGRYSRLKALFNSMEMSVTRHSRNSEFEADSLALTYFLKTGYHRLAPLQVMQILGNADKGLNRNNIDFKNHFDFKAFPFKDSWTAYSPTNLVYASLANGVSDTLRTHPNTRSRSEKLRGMLGLSVADAQQPASGGSFKHLSQLATLEVIQSHYHFKQYGKALFRSLLLVDSMPNNPYPRAMIARSLYQLYKAQKDHDLHKVLDLQDPTFDENYNRFLTFIHKLRLHELASLAYEYATNQPDWCYSDEEFIHALWQCSRFDFSKVDSDKIAGEYRQLFPEGRYLDEMNNKK